MERAIPDIVVGRLPHYLRALQHMSLEGRRLTSSQELSERLGISAAQIRKDLSLFGEFGKQGTGYQIDYLLNQLRQILKVNQIWDIALVGAGDMGSAIARYQGFTDRGFRVVMIFDNDPSVIGSQIGPFIIQSTDELVVAIQSADVRIAMLAVPAANAQEVADMLVQAGIKSILNYAPISLNVPDNVHVQYIDPVIHLQRMTYYLE
jgi:redox-sensing transcriptional repressor